MENIRISGQASLISTVFICLCCCHSSQKSLFFSTDRINLLNLKLSSDRLVIVTKGFLKLSSLYMLINKKVCNFPETWLSGLLVTCSWYSQQR